MIDVQLYHQELGLTNWVILPILVPLATCKGIPLVLSPITAVVGREGTSIFGRAWRCVDDLVLPLSYSRWCSYGAIYVCMATTLEFSSRNISLSHGNRHSNVVHPFVQVRVPVTNIWKTNVRDVANPAPIKPWLSPLGCSKWTRSYVCRSKQPFSFKTKFD
ncbi:hypothetical protein PM082_024409 [Marasmius tenuissimus]|nr:hypothetical protein PM082_024409 [Marasmius tenuissimus]